MSKRYKRLKCEKCSSLLERRYTNEYLNEKYPVDGVSMFKQQENIKIHKYSKRLWKCSKCGELVELTILQFALIILDNSRGNYII